MTVTGGDDGGCGIEMVFSVVICFVKLSCRERMCNILVLLSFVWKFLSISRLQGDLHMFDGG